MGFYEDFFAWVDEDSAPSFRARQVGAQADDQLQSLATSFVDDERGVDAVFDDLDRRADSEPYLALAQATAFVAVLNTAHSGAKGLIKRLDNAIQRLKALLQKIKINTSAQSFTITVGFPISVSISVTFG